MSNLPRGEPGDGSFGLWRLVLPGLCASLVGIGLARFAYTPLLPAIIAHGWFGAGQAAYLGAANLAGYLIGVVGSAAALRRIPAAWLLRGAMVAVVLSLLACAWPVGFSWFFAWRLVSGISGGIVMVLAAPTILPHVPADRHGIVSGAIFLGVSLGIALSGTLIPLMLRLGVAQTWLGLGLLAAIVTIAGWNGWVAPSTPAQAPIATSDTPLPTRQLQVLYLTYGLNAFALVPHMLFLVSYVARGLGQGLASGSHYWVIFGLGSMAGPLLAGKLADKRGHRATLIVTLATEALAIGLPAFASAPAALLVSSFIAGAATVGIVPVVLGRAREILRAHPAAQTAAWRSATTSFALFQAAGAYSFSFILNWTGGDYRAIFALGALAMTLALILTLAVRETATARP